MEAFHSNIVSMGVFLISGGSKHRLKSQLTLCMSFSMQMMPLYQVTRKWQSRKQSACPLCYTDVKAGFHIDDTSRRWKPMSAASKVSSAFVGDTGRHIQKYVTLLKSNPLSSYYYKDNFGGWATSYVCHPTVFHVVYSMANCNSDKDQLADQSCVTLTTSSPCSGNATFQNLS